MEQEPGSLKVFDWSGYGNGDYYPKEEKKFLWGQYAKATGDTPVFSLFENDDSAYTKVVAGARYDVAHPCGYRYKDWVDLDVLQPWDTSLIPNFSSLNPKLMPAGQFDGQQYFVPLDWGFIAPLVNLDHVDGERGDVRRAVRREVQGQDRVGRHAQHDGRRRVLPGDRRIPGT